MFPTQSSRTGLMNAEILIFNGWLFTLSLWLLSATLLYTGVESMAVFAIMLFSFLPGVLITIFAVVMY